LGTALKTMRNIKAFTALNEPAAPLVATKIPGPNSLGLLNELETVS